MLKRALAFALLLLSACSTATTQFSRPAAPLIMPTQALKPRAATTDPNALHTQALSIPVFACIPKNGQPVGNTQFTDWVNPGPAVKVSDGWVWVGAASPGGTPDTLGGKLDAAVLVQDVTSGEIFIWTNWDRYGNPIGINDDVLPFYWGQYYIVVATGDDLRFTVSCAGPYADDTQPVSVQGLFVFHEHL